MIETLGDGEDVVVAAGHHAQLARGDGAQRDGMTVDGLRLSLAGYQVWADALTPILTELLGPRAATDHAPPATGDPSAASSGLPNR